MYVVQLRDLCPSIFIHRLRLTINDVVVERMARTRVTSTDDRDEDHFRIVVDSVETPRSSNRNDDGMYTRRTPRGQLKQQRRSAVDVSKSSLQITFVRTRIISITCYEQESIITIEFKRIWTPYVYRWIHSASLWTPCPLDGNGRGLPNEFLYETSSDHSWLRFTSIPAVLVTCLSVNVDSILFAYLSLEIIIMTRSQLCGTRNLCQRPCPIAPSIWSNCQVTYFLLPEQVNTSIVAWLGMI